MVPTLGGVHKIQILIRDVLKDFLQKIFGEEMGGGQGDPDPLMLSTCHSNMSKLLTVPSYDQTPKSHEY